MLVTPDLVVQSFAISDWTRMILKNSTWYNDQIVFLRMLYLLAEAWRQSARFATTIMLWSVSGVQAGLVDFRTPQSWWFHFEAELFTPRP